MAGKSEGRGPSGRKDAGIPRSAGGASYAEFAGVGIQFALSILLFLYLGQWLDRKLGTNWLTVAGVFLGATAGFYSIYRKLMASQAREEAERLARREAERSASETSGPPRNPWERPE
jgi:F0F1-type ATP synthase assembly protein I